MSWAERRKYLILAILIGCAVAVVALVSIAVFYKVPSCTDSKQDQGEQGIDCGGPCPFACNIDETNPSVRFARAVSPQPGRTDLIAYVDNTNSNAELFDATYTVQFFNADGGLVAQGQGTITVPPSTTMPVFTPNFYNGVTPVTQVFLTIEPASYKWLRTTYKPVTAISSQIVIQNTRTPKITAVLTNTTAEPMDDVTVVATVFDPQNNAIAASQTVVEQLPGQSTAPVIFTWNEPFSGVPARVEILPAISWPLLYHHERGSAFEAY